MNSTSTPRYVIVDTRSCRNPHPFAEYNILLPSHVRRLRRLSIVSVDLPVAFYTVCPALLNDRIQITSVADIHHSDAIQLRIPAGQYTCDSLIETIRGLVSASPCRDDLATIISKGRLQFVSKTQEYIVNLDPTSLPIACDSRFAPYRLSCLLGYRSSTCYVRPSPPDARLNDDVDTTADLVLLSPRYIYIEFLDHECATTHHHRLMASTILGGRRSHHLVARVVIDYKNFPIGSLLPANLTNGYLLTTVREYKKPVDLHRLWFRLVDEYGQTVVLGDSGVSFCIQYECDEHNE
jgi:hypothetical protein